MEKNFENKIEETEFEIKRRNYCQQFALSHMSAFRPHYKKGETLGKKEGVWRNVSEHCLAAGVLADILAEELRVPAEERKKVVTAMILHDWYKKHEVQMQNKSMSVETMNEVGEKEEAELLRLGIPDEIMRLMHANMPISADGPQTTAEKIIWYVDAMLSNTEPVPIRERFDNLERGWDGSKEDPGRAWRNRAFSDMFKSRYGGQSLYDVQRQLGDRIGAEFSEAISYTGNPSELPVLLREKFVKKVMRKA